MTKTISERVPVPQRTKVKGALPFPIDMLRYDAAWPADETSSHLIEASIRHDADGKIEIELYHRRPLTAGRWDSFGWEIVHG